MTIVLNVPGVTGPGSSGPVSTFPTAQSVVNSVSDDLLQRIAPEDPVLLDYINRVQLQLLRASRWQFLLSQPQNFVTRKGVFDYYIGPAGQAPSVQSVFDTGMNITNIGPIRTDTFYDRSNFRLLKRVSGDRPVISRFANRDGQPRLGLPRLWRNSNYNPNIISIYPAPDNQNNYQPIPTSAACSVVLGGTLPARFYIVRVTYVDSLGNESAPSPETKIFVPANSVLNVIPPSEFSATPLASDTGIAYDRWNVYIFNAGTDNSILSGNETLANQSGPLSISSVYTEPNTGFLTGGASFPTTNNITAMGGYLISFQYFQAKPQVNSLTNILLIPQDYLDILVAGVNYFAAQFIKDQAAQQYWQGEYNAGITGMIRDKNLFPKSPDYISPDPTSQSYTQFFGLETDPDFYNPGID